MGSGQYKISMVSCASPLFAQVVQLGRDNSNTLGFFPEGAFSDYAGRGGLIAATNDEGALAGYVLHRSTRQECVITHVCVSDDFRGKGVAQVMVQHVLDHSKHLPSVSLWCRRDYVDARKLWHRLGFVPVAERPGRAAEGSTLEKWQYDQGQLSLLSLAAQVVHETSVPVVVDSCVFFAHYDKSDPLHEEASSLWADWLCEFAQLYVTSETYADISRHCSSDGRSIQRERVSSLLLPATEVDSGPIFHELSSLLPSFETEQDESDARHIARAIAAEAAFFLTWDRKLLRSNDLVRERFGIELVTPTDFILYVDELKRRHEYQPARVAGSHSISCSRVSAGEQQELVTRFLCHCEGERKPDLVRKLRELLQDPHTGKCDTVKRSDGTQVALVGRKSLPAGELEIALLRIKAGTLSPTLARQIISRITLDAAQEGHSLIRLTECSERPFLSTVAEESGFFFDGTNWIKICSIRSGPSNRIISDLRNFGHKHEWLRSSCEDIAISMERAMETQDPVQLSFLEHMLWPTKILDAPIPSYIVPIESAWAKELFDEDLAHQELFGAREELALNRESAYYRSRLNDGGLAAPARILWYVAKSKHFSGSGRLRACSRLCEVMVAPGKRVYQRFNRLGVYQWKDIDAISKRDKQGMLMALLFDDTYLLPHGPDWSRLAPILGTIRSPRKIDHNTFQALFEVQGDKETKSGSN